MSPEPALGLTRTQELLPGLDEGLGKCNDLLVRALLPQGVDRHPNTGGLQGKWPRLGDGGDPSQESNPLSIPLVAPVRQGLGTSHEEVDTSPSSSCPIWNPRYNEVFSDVPFLPHQALEKGRNPLLRTGVYANQTLGWG